MPECSLDGMRVFVLHDENTVDGSMFAVREDAVDFTDLKLDCIGRVSAMSKDVEDYYYASSAKGAIARESS